MKTLVLSASAGIGSLALGSVASASLAAEQARFGGYATAWVEGSSEGGGSSSFLPATTVYDNTSSTTSLAFSSTEVLTRTYGDRCQIAGTGILDSFKFSVFNSGSSAGALLSATVELSFYSYDAVSGTISLLGSYSPTVSFGTTGLSAGFYSIVESTGLSSLNINLSSTDLLVTQRITAKTGTASRTGIVSLSPVVVGSSPASFYQSSPTVTAGFYTSTSGAVNPAYQINVNAIPAPGAVALLGVAGLLAGRRRR